MRVSSHATSRGSPSDRARARRDARGARRPRAARVSARRFRARWRRMERDFGWELLEDDIRDEPTFGRRRRRRRCVHRRRRRRRRRRRKRRRCLACTPRVDRSSTARGNETTLSSGRFRADADAGDDLDARTPSRTTTTTTTSGRWREDGERRARRRRRLVERSVDDGEKIVIARGVSRAAAARAFARRVLSWPADYAGTREASR